MQLILLKIKYLPLAKVWLNPFLNVELFLNIGSAKKSKGPAIFWIHWQVNNIVFWNTGVLKQSQKWGCQTFSVSDSMDICNTVIKCLYQVNSKLNLMLAQMRKQETDESKLNDLINERQRLTSTNKQLKSETLKLRQQLEVIWDQI